VAWRIRGAAEFIAQPLYVIGRDMLIKNKRAAGREQNRADGASLALEVA
jgi:hypothetical protein